MNISDKLLFGLIFLGLFIGRLSLLGQGHLDDTDEIPFLLLIKNYDKLIALNVDAWNDQVFVMWSTYFETLYRLPQVFVLKWYASWIDMPMESTQALAIIGFFNVLVAMAISYVYYKILIRLSFNKVFALLGVLLLASFLNSNLYIRHIISYDSSFLFHLLALYILLKDKLLWKDYLLAGVFSAIGYFDYYGYFMMYPIVWMIGMYKLDNRNVKNIVIYTLYLALPSFVFLLIFHGISLLSGQSYIEYLLMFSTTIFHGSPEETLKYVYEYLHLVEGYWGLLVFFLFLLSVLYMFFYRKLYSSKSIIFLFSGIIAYLIYGMYALITSEMVFYGRVFHMYFPFVVMGILFILLKHRRFVPIFYVLAGLSFYFSITELRAIGYPRTIVYQYGLFDDNSNYQFVYEIEPGIKYDFKTPYFSNTSGLPEFRMPITMTNPAYKGHLILKNFGFFVHYPDSFMESYHSYLPPNNYKAVVNKLHFMSHPAYTFEYCTKHGRQFFLDKKFEITIYKKI